MFYRSLKYPITEIKPFVHPTFDMSATCPACLRPFNKHGWLPNELLSKPHEGLVYNLSKSATGVICPGDHVVPDRLVEDKKQVKYRILKYRDRQAKTI